MKAKFIMFRTMFSFLGENEQHYEFNKCPLVSFKMTVIINYLNSHCR